MKAGHHKVIHTLVDCDKFENLDIVNWKYFVNDKWHSTQARREIQLERNPSMLERNPINGKQRNTVEIGKRRFETNHTIM